MQNVFDDTCFQHFHSSCIGKTPKINQNHNISSIISNCQFLILYKKSPIIFWQKQVKKQKKRNLSPKITFLPFFWHFLVKMFKTIA